jgi:ClpP class serine protease
MHRALKLAASVAWAIEPQWLSTILEIANREGEGPEAVAAQLGRPLDNTRTVTVRDRVAVIPITGPIFRYANAFSAISGGTSVQVLSQDLETALASGDVDAVVLDVNSPGGQVDGIDELAAQIVAGRARKPIVAYAGGSCCSAAYWLASAADEIVIGTTSIVGSIGVLHAVPDPAAKSAKDIEIVSSRAPRKVPDVTTKQGRADIQATVDAVESVFVATVARNRGVTEKKVVTDFGQGGVLVGEAALAAGMADRIGSFESTMAAIRTRADAFTQGNHMAAQLASIALVIGLSATATEQEIVAAVQDREATRRDLLGLTGKTTSAEAIATVHAWKSTAAEHDKLAAQVSAMQAEKTAAEFEAILHEGRRSGRLTKDMEAVARTNFSDPASLRAFVAALPVLVNTAPAATPVDIVSVSALTPEERKIAAMTGVSEEQFAKTKAALKSGVTEVR